MPTASATKRAVLYARISEDASGEAAGVHRQLGDARQLAVLREWQVVEECQDNDVSALNGAYRPGYERVLHLVRQGAVDHVVVWQTSRLLRNRRERAEAIELFGRQRVGIITVKGQDLDLSKAYGRGMAGLLGEFDTMESEVKSERVAAAALQRAEKGDPNGAIPFGWSRVIETSDRGVRTGARDVRDPDTAPVVREVCARLLAGETLRGVTEWVNSTGVPAPGAKFDVRNRERGITNPDGTGWAKSSVKKLALRPANAGLRMFHAGRADERVLPAKIEPIITRAEWERLRAIFTDPERRTSKPGARKHLLSWGIGACGVCGGPLRVTLKGHQRHGTKQQVYACDGRGCVGRNQARVDELVRDVVVARLSRDDALDWLAGDDEIAGAALDRAAALRARLSQAADDYADDSITADQLRRITAKIKPQIEEAEREAADARPDVPMGLLRQVAGGVARERWDAFDVSQRRALVAALIEQVVILPVNRRGPGFDPATVEFHWRTGAENN